MRRVICHNAAVATAVGTALSCQGLEQATVQITGTFVATITWQGTIDGTNWGNVMGKPLATGTLATTATATGLYTIDVKGLTSFRANLAWTSGTSITVIANGVKHP